MFVQVIEAKTKDREAIRSEMDRWIQELGPTSEGWLGSTEGVTQDGRFIAIARFESEEQARRNSDKPEQGEWWQRVSQHFAGEATFWEATDTAGEGSDSAGFVQVMKGRVNDLEAAKRLDQQMEREMPDKRPDVIGSFTAYREDGTFYSAIYFTSLEEARRAEKEMNENPPPEMEQWGALMDGELTFYDLEEPWLHSR
jgi:hypothetical protein